MELFSLVLINMLFCGVMYVFISAKVQKAVSEYYDKKLLNAIDRATSETMREVDASVGIIESRLVAARSLIEKAEMLAKELKHYHSSRTGENQFLKQRIDEVPPYFETGMSLGAELNKGKILNDKTHSLPVEELTSLLKEQRSGIGQVYQSNQYISIDEEGIQTTEGAVNLAFAKLGKVVKGMMGIESTNTPSNEAFGKVEIPFYQPTMDYTVAGDPLAEDKRLSVVIRDENKEGHTRREFLNQLAYANDPAYAQYQKNFGDQVKLSLEAVLEELPASSTKIDKVVHLLKKGYGHEEISDVMNIGIHEIHLIETIRLDRSRRI